MEKVEKGKHLKAQGGKEPQHKGETLANQCGHTPAHNRQQCSVKDAVCNKCRNKNTLSEYANQPKVHGGGVGGGGGGGESETESESTKDDAFLGTVRQGSTDLWVTKARVNGIFSVPN